jgi:hypothetical protein
MIFDGHTSGPFYTPTVLRDDTLIKLPEIAQSELSTKLVRPQIPRRIAIHDHVAHEDEQQAAHTIEMRDHVWQNVISNLPVNDIDTGGTFNQTRQRQ